jgi:hypothetical protein
MFLHPSFDSPINSYYINNPEFTAELIIKLFYNVVQSRKNTNKLQLTAYDKLDIILSIAKTTNGCGRSKKRPLEEILNTNYVSYKKQKTLREYCKETPCMLSYEDDNYCLLISIMLGQMMHENPKQFKNYDNPKFKTLQLEIKFTNLVHDFANTHEIPDQEIGLNIDHARKIEQIINYQIVIYQDGDRT